MVWKATAAFALCAWAAALVASAQLTDSILDPAHPAIRYAGPVNDRVAALNRRLQAGDARLGFEEGTGYLRSLLAALDIPIESQIAAYSGTSLQAPLINSRNPRAIFFNDSVAVGWMPGGYIEVAALDPEQGAVFYILNQQRAPAPQLARDVRCLVCHNSRATLEIPGFLVRSIPSAIDGRILPWLGNYTTDHRSPIGERWGGWYVTGRGGGRHLGNAPLANRSTQNLTIEDANLNVTTLQGRLDSNHYLSPFSDIVALLVFDHQMRMMNLLARLGWEARVLQHEGRTNAAAALENTVTEVVDYMLFVDEAPLERVQGTSGFAERFSAAGRRDHKGRSLRDLDLAGRLMRYPCSYMIYSDAFDALPLQAKSAVYQRMWTVLSGGDRSPKYARLSADDRQAIIEIVRETKTDLPAVFSPRPSPL